jgi:putative ABC transport system substrate-binding protein
LGLVASLARPGGNATGINFFASEVVAKRLGLLHDVVPKALRIALLVNRANAPIAEATLHDISEAARTLGLQIQVFNASTSREIEAAFATLVCFAKSRRLSRERRQKHSLRLWAGHVILFCAGGVE